ncbi:hypothetical protein LCGC14_1049780 [marine sediment metagenome]|uniref:Peptidase S1 domain-containing protein n=1 Tax=marine sediment metagenome TaxID=412755 RepID=A0A0F9MTM8_9ZZZZ
MLGGFCGDLVIDGKEMTMMTKRQMDIVGALVCVILVVIGMMIVVLAIKLSPLQIIHIRQNEKACVARWNTEFVAILPMPEPEPLSFTDLVQTSLKGVVHLQAPSWQGSGFVIGPRMVVTARHCVENITDFVLTTHDGHQVRATRAISAKEHDVAFIWIDDLTCVAEERGTLAHDVVLSPLLLGSIEDCVLGQSVYVIGSPYGKINFNSITKGIISGVDRNWGTTNPYTGESYGWEVAFTVDSAGHPGNSGGPVFTADGVIRGILVGGYSPVLINVMPCDLFLGDLESIRLMFLLDRYRREEVPVYDAYDAYNEWSNQFEGWLNRSMGRP